MTRRSSVHNSLLATESVMGLIERHRQDQERLLRSVASGGYILSQSLAGS